MRASPNKTRSIINLVAKMIGDFKNGYERFYRFL
jgi:hypothetical protein